MNFVQYSASSRDKGRHIAYSKSPDEARPVLFATKMSTFQGIEIWSNFFSGNLFRRRGRSWISECFLSFPSVYS
jgi:hypothetical protein